MSAILASGPEVRCVAVADGGNVTTRQRHDLPAASLSESDGFEEPLVNPALVLLAQQRGNIACGGLRYLIARYRDVASVRDRCGVELRRCALPTMNRGSALPAARKR
jgi:hypothetical protein